MISINYNDKDYELLVMETKPGNAVSIIECDMDVDFAPPVGYEEPNYRAGPSNIGSQKTQKTQQPVQAPAKNDGYRLDGKSSSRKRNELSTSSLDGTRPGTSGVTASTGATTQSCGAEARGTPFYDYKIGLIRFHHNFDELSNQMVV